MLSDIHNKDLSWSPGPDASLSEAKQSLYSMVDQAREQWQLAQEYFEFVREPDLVDLAINNLEVAEKRYNYFLKQLRHE